MQRALVLVQVLDEFRDAALVIKLVRFFLFLALIPDEYSDAFIEERLFPKALGKFFETVDRSLENTRVGSEGDLRPSLRRFSRLLERCYGETSLVLLLKSFAVTPDLEL